MNKDVIILDILETHIKYEKCLSPINQKCLLEYIENLQKKAELGDHYKHLYSKIKKQKDDVIEYIKNNKLFKYVYDEEELFEIITDKQAKEDLLRMLGEIDVED